jgi:hypothetical protein
MTQADQRLKALFAAGEPPARDPAFSARVMEQVLRRKLREDLLLLSGLSLLGGLMLWALWPVLATAAVAVTRGLAPAALTLVLLMSVGVILGGRLRAALGLAT